MYESQLDFIPVLLLYAGTIFIGIVYGIYVKLHSKSPKDQDEAFYRNGGDKAKGLYCITGSRTLKKSYQLFFVGFFTVITLMRLFFSYSLAVYIFASVMLLLIYVSLDFMEFSSYLLVDGDIISYSDAGQKAIVTFFDIKKIELDRAGAVNIMLDSMRIYLSPEKYSPRFMDDIRKRHIPIEHYITVANGRGTKPGAARRDPDYKE